MTCTVSRGRRLLARSGTALAVAGVATAAALGFAQPALAQPAADFATIDRYVEAERQALGLPGVAIGIVRGDQVVHLAGFGQADPSGRPVTPQTPFIMGSVAKSFTALAVVQLAEAGRLDLDAPVRRYLPWFAVADAGSSARITPRHLLNQTSGLSASAGMDVLLTTDLEPGAAERAVRSLASEAPFEEPGRTFEYSNINYVTLGLVVETVTGRTYDAYVREHVFAPLGMQRSFTEPAQAAQAGLATGHTGWFGFPRPTPAEGLHSGIANRAAIPAGLISSTAEDMTRYLIAHLHEGRYGATSIASPAGIAALHDGVAEAGPMGSYGMGWAESQELAGHPVHTVWHNGDTTDWHADMRLVPEQGWGVVLLANGNNALQAERIAALGGSVTALVLGLPPAPTPPYSVLLWQMIAVGGVLLAEAVGIARSAVLVRRWRARPERRPRGAAAVGLRLALPSALIVVVAWLPLVALGAPYGTLPNSDGGVLLLATGVLALVWSALRVALLVLAARGGSSGTEPARPPALPRTEGLART